MVATQEDLRAESAARFNDWKDAGAADAAPEAPGPVDLGESFYEGDPEDLELLNPAAAAAPPMRAPAAEPRDRSRFRRVHPFEDERDDDEGGDEDRLYEEIVVRERGEKLSVYFEKEGDRQTLTLRKVGAMELPDVDALEMRLARTRKRLASCDRSTRGGEREYQRQRAEYNLIMEELVSFTVELPEGFYQRLDTVALGEIQSRVAKITRAARGEPVNDDEGDEDGDEAPARRQPTRGAFGGRRPNR